MSARGFLGAGNLQFSLIVNDIAQGFGDKRETSKFEIKPNSEIKELVSKGRDSYGQVIETVALQQPAEVSISLREADYENLKLSFMGTDGTGANQAAATVTDEAINAKLGKYVPLANRNLASAGLSVTNAAEDVTYINGTDYVVDYRLGEIKALAEGAIADAQALKVNYTAQAYTGTKILGNTQTSIRAVIRFDGVNLADGKPVILTAWEGVFTPDSAFDMLADDFGEVQLKGRLKTPAGKASPFEVEFLTL
ncbi:MAG: hypothetical protein IAE92_02470 [Burkholderiaceae bacterium]|nr:hypothetical protein [Burkholderiaceae bacterium]